MTSYNIVKPLTRAQFIQELGADNLPWILLASAVVVAVMRTEEVLEPRQTRQYWYNE